MRAPLFLLAFLHVFVASDVDPLTQIAQDLFKEDFFYTHLKSEFVNNSIDPCDNFYRRHCPREFPEESWIWFKMLRPLYKIASDLDEKIPIIPEEYAYERHVTSDEIRYSEETIEKGISFISFDTFMHLFKVVSSKTAADDKYTNNISYLVKKKFETNKTMMVNALVRKIVKYLYEEDRKFRTLGKESGTAYLQKAWNIKNFEVALQVDRVILRLVQKKGVNYVEARERMESLISNIIEEYISSIKEAPWNSKEDRFGNTHANLMTKYIRDLYYAIASTNRYSLPDRDTLIDNYRKAFVEAYKDLSELSSLPDFRIFLAKNRAMDRALEQSEYSDIHKVRGYTRIDAMLLSFEAFASPKTELDGSFYHPMIVMNQVLNVHAAFTAETASFIGITGFAFAHEMYHQIQFIHTNPKLESAEIIEDLSDNAHAAQCVTEHMNRVCSRFTEQACASGEHVRKEDGADIYSIQILYKVMRKMLGEDIDRIVFPDLNMTHRELFYHSIAANLCTRDYRSQWIHDPSKDKHNGWIYRVNGMLGQLPDFKQTFACYDDDRMVFPENSMCPVFSEGFAK